MALVKGAIVRCHNRRTKFEDLNDIYTELTTKTRVLEKPHGRQCPRDYCRKSPEHLKNRHDLLFEAQQVHLPHFDPRQ